MATRHRGPRAAFSYRCGSRPSCGIHIAAEYLSWSGVDAATRVEQTATRLVSVINYAEREGLPTNYAADELARQRLAIPAPMAA